MLGLPRSRTAWLSHWLSYQQGGKRMRRVGHDEFSRCSSVQQCLDLFEGAEGLDGTCETGAAFAARLLQREMPKARMLVVRRNPEQCRKSLELLGLYVPAADWLQRVSDIWAVSALPGVRTVEYEDLRSESCCKWIWSWLLGLEWDKGWWEHWTAINVQVDIGLRVKELLQRADAVQRLKAEVKLRLEGMNNAA